MDEENKNLTDADHVRNMLESDGWKIVYPKFEARIMDLQNIHNLDMTRQDTLATQLASRQMAVASMVEWYKKDVQGFVQQQELNNADLSEKAEPFIERN